MKSLAIAALLSLPAFASFIQPTEGDYASPKTIALPSKTTPELCHAGGGFWSRGGCYFTTSDDASVHKTSAGYEVTVSTVGTNGLTCHFQSQGRPQVDGTLIATLATAVGPCEVSIRYEETNWISVKSVGACDALCESEGLSLDIAHAKRVDISGP